MMGSGSGMWRRTYLGAELDVDGDDGRLHHGQGENHGHDGQEAEHIVVSALVLPETAEDEEQLDEDDGEGDETGEDSRLDGASVPRLRRDLARDGIGFDGVAVGATADEAVPAADVDERELDQKPEGEESKESTEGDGSGGGVCPDEEVEDEDCSEQEAGDESGGHDSVVFPHGAAKGLVDACGEVAGEGAGEDEKSDADADEATAEAGVKDAEA